MSIKFFHFFLSKLPNPIRIIFSIPVGIVLFIFLKKRRNICFTNLRICFPTFNKVKIFITTLKTFIVFVISVFDSFYFWEQKKNSINNKIHIKNEKLFFEFLKKNKTIIILPHFFGIELVGLKISSVLPCAIHYLKQKNQMIDTFLKEKRNKFKNVVLIEQKEGFNKVISSINNKLPFIILPDMDFGIKNNKFIDFFNVPASTVDTIPRLAKITKSKVILLKINRKFNGYFIEFFKFDDLPSSSINNDLIKINKVIESIVSEKPYFYYWFHRRFKTRPNNHEKFY
jgi:KDO2-lipid IV(A) lauroyltransferase